MDTIKAILGRLRIIIIELLILIVLIGLVNRYIIPYEIRPTFASFCLGIGVIIILFKGLTTPLKPKSEQQNI